MGINVLSLFDGMSIGRLALERAGIEVDNYFASEIDKYAIKVSEKNWPDSIQLGTVLNWNTWNLPKIDLLIGGSPCQGFSLAGKQGGTRAILNGEEITISNLTRYKELKNEKDIKFLSQSYLFWEFVDCLKTFQSKGEAKYFLLENVKMNKENNEMITKALGVEPIEINSALVSAQNRKRLYWTNIPNVEQPKDKGINLEDILEKELKTCRIGAAIRGRYDENRKIEQQIEIRKDNKSNTLTTVQKDNVISYIKTDKKLKIKNFQNKASCLTGGANSGGNHSDMDILIIIPDVIRRYSVKECERLQTVPDAYTEGVSDSQRYKMLGNGWTTDVIAHIFESLKKQLT